MQHVHPGRQYTVMGFGTMLEYSENPRSQPILPSDTPQIMDDVPPEPGS